MTTLAYLCWVIAVGSFVAGGFTLRRMFAHRRQRTAGQMRGDRIAIDT